MLELIKIRKDIAWALEQIKCLFAKGTYATAWSENHTLTTGGPYLKGTIIWHQGFIYKAIHNNESELPTNPIYWECIGEGFLLEEKIPDWWALPGTKTFIKNKPTKTSDFLNDGELGTSPYATEEFVVERMVQAGAGDKNFVYHQNIPATVWTISHPLAKFASVTVIDSAGTQVQGQVEYININTIILTFSAAFSGTATLN